VGLSGAGLSSGLAVGHYEICASIILLILGWVFVPFYLRSAVYTMPEFLERRYGPASRWYLAVISIIGYVLTKISVTIFAGGIVFEALLGVPFWTGAIVVVAITGLYTVFGGLRAVLYTELIQMFVLIGGAVLATGIGLSKLGGWNTMVEAAPDDFMNMWKPMTDPDFPWTGILLGAPILGVWYWCTDQYIVQRVLAARNLDQARLGTTFAGFLKLLPMFIFVVPGIVAYGLAQQNRLVVDEADAALPTLVREMLPMGVRGLVAAGFLAALMSSLSSVFNSCSTLITWDIYKRMAPNASERRLVIVGQIATVGLVIAGLLWIPFMERISGQLYQYLQNVQGYIAPPIAAVFLVGIFWKRVNGAGAIAALLTGFALGMGRLVLELSVPQAKDFTVISMHFLHFAALLFVVCSVVLVVVSLAAPPRTEKDLTGLTFQTTPRDPGSKRPSPVVVLASVLVGLAVLVIWAYFSPLFFGGS
jgi:SSS family solute:Na+ symporter